MTFDYEGCSQAVAPARLPAEAVRRVRQELGGGEVLRRERASETTQVVAPRRAEAGKAARGEAPEFSDKGFSVVEALGDGSRLAEGVRITELRGGSNNVSLEHRARRPSGRPHRLSDYQALSKEKSFREFPPAASRKHSLDLSADQQDPLLTAARTQRAAGSSGKSEQGLQAWKGRAVAEAMGRGLPFIRTKGLKFYDIGSASSFKTVDFSFHSSARKSNWRSSRIRITDPSLCDEVLLN